MKPLKYLEGLEKRIRGWLPKDSVKAYLQKISKPVWWRPLWIAVVILTIASGILAFFAQHLPFQQVVIGTASALVCIGVAYHIRVEPSFKVNRTLYVLLGITPFGFVISIAYAVLLGRYVTGWLLGGFNVVVIVGILIAGGFVGDWIGKRRNYQLPLSI
jgi:hypothetical protein